MRFLLDGSGEEGQHMREVRMWQMGLCGGSRSCFLETLASDGFCVPYQKNRQLAISLLVA